MSIAGISALPLSLACLLLIGCSPKGDDGSGRQVPDAKPQEAPLKNRESSVKISPHSNGDGEAEIVYWLDAELPGEISDAIAELREVKRLRRELKEATSRGDVPSDKAEEEVRAWAEAEKMATFRGACIWKDSNGCLHLLGLGEMTIDVDESDKSIWKRYRRFADQKARQACAMLIAGDFRLKSNDEADGKVVLKASWTHGGLSARNWVALEKRDEPGIVRLISIAHGVVSEVAEGEEQK